MPSSSKLFEQKSQRIDTAGADGSEAKDSTTITVGLVPSPGLPEDIANDIREDLVQELSDQVDDSVTWRIRVVPDPLSGTQVETPDLLGELDELAQADAWDYSIALTDLPVRRDKHVVLADASTKYAAGWISIPALGLFRIRRRVRQLVVQVVRDLHGGATDEEDVEAVIGSHVAERAKLRDAPDVVDTRWVAPSILAYIKLIGGMVYANEPWTILPRFKTTIATAVATGSYGLIFTSIWELGANYYDPVRLAGLALMAITILSTWIIISHRLWQPHRLASSQFLAATYNAATVVTIASGVIFSYALIYLVLLIEASVFMPPSRLESVLGRSPNAPDYFSSAVVAASIGTLAGALGAGLENTEVVRKATFGWRQQQRFEEYEQARKEEEEDTEENR